ncbi:MAG: hypothetical protein ACI4SB_05520, partial [Acutalibacteraceae bacterium]
KNSRKHRSFLLGLVAIYIAAVITLVIIFIILDQKYGRTGLTELIPLDFIFVYFCLENYTDFFERTDEKKTAKKEKLSV